MAVTYTTQTVFPLSQGVAGAIICQVGTDEAITVTASKNGGAFGAVDAATTATKIIGSDSAVLYKLAVAAADTATPGPICFQLKGATSTMFVMGYVYAWNATGGILPANGIPVGALATGAIVAATFGAGAITNTVLATDSIGADELAADAIAEIVAATTAVAPTFPIFCHPRQKSEPDPTKRTIFWEQTGTLPANLSLRKNGGSPANSSVLPSTVTRAISSFSRKKRGWSGYIFFWLSESKVTVTHQS